MPTRTAEPPPATILVVDDDRGLLRLVEKTLKREGYVTATAASGREAIEWLGRNHADLLLLDLKLPDIEGKELINHLESIGRRTPFIVITGQGDERVAVEMMRRGALDYLVKDVRFQEFVPTVVQRALNQLEQGRKLTAAEEEGRRLQQEILTIVEREQRRIGHDLHDGLSQQLAGIEFMSQVLHQKLAGKAALKPEAASAAEIARLVRESIAHTRDLSRGLTPVVLESEGLMSALQELAAGTSRLFHVECTFDCATPVLFHDNAVATHLYRIAQEAISNALKHGKARRIEISLVQNAGRLMLAVRDNGSGLPADAAHRRGMGLRIMQYRAGMIGGSLVVQRAPDGGTSVVCTLQKTSTPLPP